MKYADLAKQEYAYPRPFPFSDFRPKSHKQPFNIGPADRAADGMGEDRI